MIGNLEGSNGTQVPYEKMAKETRDSEIMLGMKNVTPNFA
jgi:hypothetical protein